MPFGMTNSPATFQHFMNDIFHDMADIFVIVYLDDILVYSENEADHEEHVCQVLQRLHKHNLHAKLGKCTFHSDTNEYLGFIVSPAGILMDSAKMQVKSDWPVPKNVKQVQSFLGFTNFYWHFIANYSDICKVLLLILYEIPILLCLTPLDYDLFLDYTFFLLS